MYIVVRDTKIIAVSEHEIAAEDAKTVKVENFDASTIGRAFYKNERIVVYDPLTVSDPATATVNTPITITATLPDSPDTEVQFQVAWQDADGVWHRTDSVSVAVVNGQASKDFQFASAGKYLIEALSEHHGLASAEVVVS